MIFKIIFNKEIILNFNKEILYRKFKILINKMIIKINRSMTINNQFKIRINIKNFNRLIFKVKIKINVIFSEILNY